MKIKGQKIFGPKKLFKKIRAQQKMLKKNFCKKSFGQKDFGKKNW